MDNAVLTVFHDAHVVDGAISAPVKEDNIPGHRLIVSLLPLSLRFEPIHAVGAEGKLWYDPCLDVAALIGTP